MNRALRLALLTCCIAIGAGACSNGDGASAAASADLPPGGGGGDPALQKQLAPPAPEGALALNVETIADGLVNPWSLAWLPNGDILVTEREGRIRIIRDDALLDAPVANAPETLAWNQGGYFDVLPHPGFAENNLLYLAFAHGTREENTTRIIRAEFVNDTLQNIKVIYDAAPLKDTGHHFGGRMVWGPDGKLYATIGEGSKYKEKAQDMTSSFGAVIRINEDGSVPEDNPDFGADALPELYSKGHRNGQGLSFDVSRGVLWEHEHGARGGDEINVVEAGENYGWPIATYGTEYSGARVTPFTEYEGTKQPFKYWTPSIAPSGLAVYDGDLFPEDWKGDLLLGAMKSGSEALHRIDLDGMEEKAEERYLLGERIREVRVGPDGAIYVTTEDRGGDPVGKVLRVTPQ